MKHRSNPKSKTKSTKPKLNSLTDFSPIAKEPFEQEYKIIDAAITSALIAGISPSVMDNVLIPSFLSMASNTRDKSQDTLSKWTSNPDYIWQPIIQCVHDMIEDLEEPTIFVGFEELHNLKTHHNIDITTPDEMEFHRQLKRAQEVLNYALDLVSTEDEDQNKSYNRYAIEKSFLLATIKSAVIQDKLEDAIYIIARQHMHRIFDRYNELMLKL